MVSTILTPFAKADPSHARGGTTGDEIRPATAWIIIAGYPPIIYTEEGEFNTDPHTQDFWESTNSIPPRTLSPGCRWARYWSTSRRYNNYYYDRSEPDLAHPGMFITYIEQSGFDITLLNRNGKNYWLLPHNPAAMHDCWPILDDLKKADMIFIDFGRRGDIFIADHITEGTDMSIARPNNPEMRCVRGYVFAETLLDYVNQGGNIFITGQDLGSADGTGCGNPEQWGCTLTENPNYGNGQEFAGEDLGWGNDDYGGELGGPSYCDDASQNNCCIPNDASHPTLWMNVLHADYFADNAQCDTPGDCGHSVCSHNMRDMPYMDRRGIHYYPSGWDPQHGEVDQYNCHRRVMNYFLMPKAEEHPLIKGDPEHPESAMPRWFRDRILNHDYNVRGDPANPEETEYWICQPHPDFVRADFLGTALYYNVINNDDLTWQTNHLGWPSFDDDGDGLYNEDPEGDPLDRNRNNNLEEPFDDDGDGRIDEDGPRIRRLEDGTIIWVQEEDEDLHAPLDYWDLSTGHNRPDGYDDLGTDPYKNWTHALIVADGSAAGRGKTVYVPRYMLMWGDDPDQDNWPVARELVHNTLHWFGAPRGLAPGTQLGLQIWPQIDNDRDGWYNEDCPDGFDDDLDGVEGEDCEEPPNLDLFKEKLVVQASPGSRVGIPLIVKNTSDTYQSIIITAMGVPSVLGRQIDNDGDGKINEDLPDGLDNDGDGSFDEDGLDNINWNDEDLDMFDPQDLERMNEDSAAWQDLDGDGFMDGDDDHDMRVDEDRIELPDDDDGDGLYDEDWPDGEDNDGDGLIDEDDLRVFDNDHDGLCTEEEIGTREQAAGELDVYPVTTPITVDGVFDPAEWANSNYSRMAPPDQVAFGFFEPGYEDASATIYALWDENNLYLAIVVKDDKTIRIDPFAGMTRFAPWDDDSLEICLDGDNSKGLPKDTNDKCWLIDLRGRVFEDGVYTPSPEIMLDFTWEQDQGYTVEAAIPWSVLEVTPPPSVDQEIGLDVFVNDDDNGRYRDGQLAWSGADPEEPNPRIDQDPSLWGTITIKEQREVFIPPIEIPFYAEWSNYTTRTPRPICYLSWLDWDGPTTCDEDGDGVWDDCNNDGYIDGDANGDGDPTFDPAWDWDGPRRDANRDNLFYYDPVGWVNEDPLNLRLDRVELEVSNQNPGWPPKPKDRLYLVFDHWYIVQGYDSLFVEVSTDGGVSWSRVDPVNPPYYNTSTSYGRRPGWGSTYLDETEGQWITSKIDLTPFIGEKVLVRFRAMLGYDYYPDWYWLYGLWYYDGKTPGWQIDNIRVVNEACELTVWEAVDGPSVGPGQVLESSFTPGVVSLASRGYQYWEYGSNDENGDGMPDICENFVFGYEDLYCPDRSLRMVWGTTAHNPNDPFAWPGYYVRRYSRDYRSDIYIQTPEIDLTIAACPGAPPFEDHPYPPRLRFWHIHDLPSTWNNDYTGSGRVYAKLVEEDRWVAIGVEEGKHRFYGRIDEWEQVEIDLG